MKRYVIAVVIVAGLMLVVGLGNHAPKDLTSPVERIARVDRIVDGDSLVLEGGERIRLVGIDAPEIGEQGGYEALEFVEATCPPGSEVGLNVDALSPTDRYGRTLAVVYLRAENGWLNLNAELLNRGLAEVLFVPPSEFNPYAWLKR
jgi:micrococcal nuclease